MFPLYWKTRWGQCEVNQMPDVSFFMDGECQTFRWWRCVNSMDTECGWGEGIIIMVKLSGALEREFFFYSYSVYIHLLSCSGMIWWHDDASWCWLADVKGQPWSFYLSCSISNMLIATDVQQLLNLSFFHHSIATKKTSEADRTEIRLLLLAKCNGQNSWCACWARCVINGMIQAEVELKLLLCSWMNEDWRFTKHRKKGNSVVNTTISSMCCVDSHV